MVISLEPEEAMAVVHFAVPPTASYVPAAGFTTVYEKITSALIAKLAITAAANVKIFFMCFFVFKLNEKIGFLLCFAKFILQNRMQRYNFSRIYANKLRKKTFFLQFASICAPVAYPCYLFVIQHRVS